MLQAGNHKDVRIAVHEALISCVLNKSGAEEHDVVKLASELPPQQVQKILCLTRIGGSELVCVCVACCVCLVLHRFQLPFHNVQLRVRDGEDVTVGVSRP